MSDIAFLSASELAEKIRHKEISSEELLRHYLDRIDCYNPALKAVVLDWRDQALDEARTADAKVAAGEELGPLHGVPMTIKESYRVAGTPATWGNPDQTTNIGTDDAVAVKRLKEAGVVLFGKTNVPLSLADLQSYNDVYGTTGNPWDLTRTPGGSSGGSAAALAAGLTGFDAGSDIGGSIRNPAHFCGVFGHKPTHNLVCMDGHALDQSRRAAPDISVIGPMSRSAKDLLTALNVMAGPNEILARGYRLALPTLEGRRLGDLRVAVWSDDAVCAVSEETVRHVEAVAQACADAGAHVDRSARPDFDPAHSHETYSHLLQAEMASRMSDDDYESIKHYLESVDTDKANPRTLATLRAQVGSFKDWKAHNEAREKLRWEWHEFFKDYDVLLLPTTPTEAFEHDHSRLSERTILVDDREIPYFDQVFWCGLASLCYLPATVIPTGLSRQGLPIGVQIVGPELGDMITLGVACELEAAGFRFTAPARYA